jgi:FtsP/CotA-like multicopper oxidase with cupredoxin domain
MLTRRAVVAALATSAIEIARPVRGQAQAGPTEPGVAGNGMTPTFEAAPIRTRLDASSSGEADLWTFGRRTPLRFRHGNEVQLTLKNSTPAPLSIHWHGVRGPSAMDGVGGLTQDPVAPGQSFTYKFTPPDPGTFLVRPCVLGGSAVPTERGLTALLIVEEAAAPQVDHDVALLVDDWLLTETGALAPFAETGQANPAGRLGNWLSVNRKPIPERIEVAPGSRIRVRLANGSNARTMRLRFDGIRPYVIAVDGQPTDTFEPLKASLPFAPGTRYDLLLDMPPEAGQTGSVVGQVGAGVALVTLVTAGAKRTALPPIAPLAPNPKLPPAITLQSASRAEVRISGEERPDAQTAWLINGKPGSASVPLIKVKRGSPVVVALNNQTRFVQPFHLHGHSFRLLHPYDDGWDPYFLDTVQVPENRTVRIAFPADNPGRWLLASTVLERFDAGLWTWIEVA